MNNVCWNCKGKKVIHVEGSIQQTGKADCPVCKGTGMNESFGKLTIWDVDYKNEHECFESEALETISTYPHKHIGWSFTKII